MSTTNPLPILITFDGEARSGKGTIVQATKDYLRDTAGYKVMLIDAGQVFRVLVVGATNSGVDLDNPAAIDEFLNDNESAEECVRLIKQVYHMDKDQRDGLLYTNQVGRNSAKIGARPLSQAFKDQLLKKWLGDARQEGYQIVLLDGRALEEVGAMLEQENLCQFKVGLYFICDPYVGARRTLGYAKTQFDKLASEDQAKVEELVKQINARNQSDRDRVVQPIKKPTSAPTIYLPDVTELATSQSRFMATVDTSADMTKQQMTGPVMQLIAELLKN